MNKKSFGKFLQEARQKNNYSQSQLAKLLHVSRQAISYWENDNHMPDNEKLKDVCNLLNIDFKQIKDLYFEDINKRKEKKKKMCYLVISLVIGLMFILLTINILVIKFHNTINVYTGYIDNPQFSLSNSIFIETKEKYILSLGVLTKKLDKKDNYDIKLYYRANGKERIIISTSYKDNIILSEDYGYNEFFGEDFDINEVYIDFISQKDKTNIYTYKLNFKKEFGNNKLFYLKKKRIVEDDSDNITQEIISMNNLEEKGYKLEGDNYVKKNGDDSFTYSPISNILIYFDESVYIKYDLKYDSISASKYNYDLNKFDFRFNYSVSENNLDCHEGDCQEYQKYVDLIKNEVI